MALGIRRTVRLSSLCRDRLMPFVSEGGDGLDGHVRAKAAGDKLGPPVGALGPVLVDMHEPNPQCPRTKGRLQLLSFEPQWCDLQQRRQSPD